MAHDERALTPTQAGVANDLEDRLATALLAVKLAAVTLLEDDGDDERAAFLAATVPGHLERVAAELPGGGWVAAAYDTVASLASAEAARLRGQQVDR